MIRIWFFLASAALAVGWAAQAVAAGSDNAQVKWGGFYAGGQIGYGLGSEFWTLVDNPGGPVAGGGEDPPEHGGPPLGSTVASDDPSGLIGGIHLGYNWPKNSFFYGIEAGLDLAGIDGSASSISMGEKPGPRTWSSKMRFLATFGPRFGLIRGNNLVYGEGGLAAAREDFFHLGAYGGAPTTPPPMPAPAGRTYTASAFQVGWYIGGGLEHAFSSRWSGRIEYNFVDLFGRQRLWGKPANPAVFDLVQGDHILKLGLTYHFAE